MHINCAPTRVLASIFAPRSSSSFTMLAFPLFDATCKGVMSFCGRREEKYSFCIFSSTKTLFSKMPPTYFHSLYFYRTLWTVCFKYFSEQSLSSEIDPQKIWILGDTLWGGVQVYFIYFRWLFLFYFFLLNPAPLICFPVSLCDTYWLMSS